MIPLAGIEAQAVTVQEVLNRAERDVRVVDEVSVDLEPQEQDRGDRDT